VSSYEAYAIHPLTKKIEIALWVDDYYGRHEYGVMFGDGTVYPAERCHPRPTKKEARESPVSQKERYLSEPSDWRQEAKRLLFYLNKIENVVNNGGKIADVRRVLAEVFSS
jgi:hypothetical protein